MKLMDAPLRPNRFKTRSQREGAELCGRLRRLDTRRAEMTSATSSAEADTPIRSGDSHDPKTSPDVWVEKTGADVGVGFSMGVGDGSRGRRAEKRRQAAGQPVISTSANALQRRARKPPVFSRGMNGPLDLPTL